MDTPSAPSFSLNTKSWHESCRTEHFSVRPRRSHFSVPTAVRLRRREHGGRLCHAGGEGDHHRMGLPASTSHVPYSVWEAEAGRPSKTMLSASSESVILLKKLTSVSIYVVNVLV